MARRGETAGHAGDAGANLGAKARLQPHEEVHEGAVKHRIALAQQGYVASLRENDREPLRALLVKRRQRADIFGLGERPFGRHRIGQQQLLAAGAKISPRDFSRMAFASELGEIGDDRRVADDARGLHRDEFGIAGPKPDAI